MVVIPRDLAERCEVAFMRLNQFTHVPEYKDGLASDAAAIRALLEPHDGAIEVSGRVTVDRARFERLESIEGAAIYLLESLLTETERTLVAMSTETMNAASRLGKAIEPGDLEPLP